jgi:hypothetical protein
VANTLAATPEFMDDFTVQSVTTFGAPVNACPHPAVAYRRYIVEGDLVPLLHWAAIWSRLEGHLEVLKSPCEEEYDYLKQTFVGHSPGPNGMKNPHSSYEYSQDLVEEQLPFLIHRYDSIGRFSTGVEE